MSAVKRSSSLELYRILVMLLIIAHHYVVNSNLPSVLPDSSRTLFYHFLGAWGKTGINCFMLITGYFLCKGTWAWQRLFKYVIVWKFWQIVFFCVFLYTGLEVVSPGTILRLLLPVNDLSANFVFCFLVFYLLIPYLNVLITHLDKQHHLSLICILLAIYTGIGFLPGFVVQYNYATWFCIIYLIGSYLRLYPESWFDNNRKWGGYLLLSLLISCFCIWQGSGGYLAKFGPWYFLADSHQILAVSNAICSFMFFRNLKCLADGSVIINRIAATTFGVLLIHTNSVAMRNFLWDRVVNVEQQSQSPHYIIYAFLSIIIVFCVCSILEELRLRLFDLLKRKHHA